MVNICPTTLPVWFNLNNPSLERRKKTVLALNVLVPLTITPSLSSSNEPPLLTDKIQIPEADLKRPF
jgi:hypothetical protein